MTFASPLPVGAAGLQELGAFDLSARMDPAQLPQALNPHLPEGLRVTESWEVPPGRGTFGSRMESLWRVGVKAAGDDRDLAGLLGRAVEELMNADSLVVARREGGTRDVRDLVLDAAFAGARDEGGREAVLEMVLLQSGDLSARPQDVVRALEEWAGPLEVTSLERAVIYAENCNLREVPRLRRGVERAAGGRPESGERR